MTSPFLGELALVPYSFAPKGWAFCHGQLLPINQNQALFALLGTTYGGNGQTSFALPDLRGRVPLSSGQGPGLSPYQLGQAGGTERVGLTGGHLPPHDDDGALAADVSAPLGKGFSGQPHENRQPYLTLNWIIALQGAFPNQF